MHSVMNKIFLLFIVCLLTGTTSFAQNQNVKMFFVIDSIPVLDDPEEGNEVKGGDVSDLTVIKNKDSLKLLGYAAFDGVTYIFTKEYRNRPDSLKRIPSTKQMERKSGVWLLAGNPYNGRFYRLLLQWKNTRRRHISQWQVNGAPEDILPERETK
jgi:hypothetical protein